MTSRWLLVLALTLCFGDGPILAEEVQEVDICEVIRSPENYAGKFIRTSGRVSVGLLKTSERYIGFHCPGGAVLVVTPDEITPRPDFSLSEDAEIGAKPCAAEAEWDEGAIFRTGCRMLVDGKIRDAPGYFVHVRLEGRFDWVGVDIPPYPLKWARKIQGRIDWKSLRTKTGERVSKKDLYGKAKLPMRLVLRRVSDVRLQEIPRRHRPRSWLELLLGFR